MGTHFSGSRAGLTGSDDTSSLLRPGSPAEAGPASSAGLNTPSAPTTTVATAVSAATRTGGWGTDGERSSSSSSHHHNPLVCSRCLAAASWSRQILLCGRCHFPYCTECMDTSVTLRKRKSTSRSMMEAGGRANSLHCPSCRSPLLRLPDALLRYIALFLSYTNRDRLLSVCTRFRTLVWVPYPYVKNLEHTLQWREPFDVIYTSPRSVVLRCHLRTSGGVIAVKLIPKNSLLSRRLWQRLQDYLDICVGCNFYRPSPSTAGAGRVTPTPTNVSPPFPTVLSIFHSRELICVGTHYLAPARYRPLFDALQFATTRTLEGGDEVPVWTEVLCLRVLQKLLDAVAWLHGTLKAVHRSISLETVHVDTTTDINDYGVCLLGFSSARFTCAPSQRPRFAPTPTAEHCQRTGVAQDLLETRPREEPVGGRWTVGAAALSGRLSPLPSPHPPSTSAAGGSGTGQDSSSKRKRPVRPLLLDIVPVSAVQRNADVYSRAAREREALLTGGYENQLFARPAPYTERLFFSRRLAKEVIGRGGAAAAARPASQASVPRSPSKAIEVDGDSEHSVSSTSPLLVATPRAATGFAAPELLPSLVAKSTIPSTGATAEDMQSWDAFALGGVWYHMLSAVVRMRQPDRHDGCQAQPATGVPPLADLGEVRMVVSDGAFELLLRLMHVDPAKRWSCQQALRLVDELLAPTSD